MLGKAKDHMATWVQIVGVSFWLLLPMVVKANAQVIPMSFLDMISAADTIVVAETIDSRSEWVNTGTSRAIVTRVTFRVTNTLKGLDRILMPLEFLGGTVGDTRQEVSGVPKFYLGDRAVLFVSGERTASPIVGRMQGLFPINTGPDDSEYVTLHDQRAFSTTDQIGAPILVSPVAIPTMSLAAFQDAITQLTQ